MADFLQSKNLTTLVEICFNSQAINLKKYVDSMVVVVIPCHIKHLEQGLIVDLLKKLHFVNYVREFVIVINGSLSDSNDKIRDLKLIDSRITVLLENPDFKTQLQPYLDFNTKSLRGKGYALWLGFAYVCNKYKHLAIIATIDADIKTFTHDFLLKLLYPLVHFGAHLNKGYYVRYADEKLTGRLARLLVFPLLQAMKLQLGSDNLCDFLSEFRYPISGDVAITSRLISQLSLMQGWSYDLSLLIQARKRTISEKLFQTEVTDNYQHINREVNAHDNGLLITATEIIAYLMSLYPLNSVRLITDYRNCAANYIIKYECVAEFNSLAFSRADEENLVILLSDLLKDKQPEYITLPALNLVDVKPGFSSLISTLVVL